MLQRCLKRSVLCGLSLVLAVLAPGPAAKAETSPLAMTGDCPRCTTVTGIVDRVSGGEIVIGDSLYQFASDSGSRRAPVSRGQLVTGELDEQKNIRSLRRLTPGKTTRAPGAPTFPQPGGRQPLRLEGGVWKN